MRAILEIRSGSDAGAKLPLKPGQPLRIGRNPKADRAFPGDRLMSSLHFAINQREKSRLILDLQTSNGTSLNGARVKEAFIAGRGEIRVGTASSCIRGLYCSSSVVSLVMFFERSVKAGVRKCSIYF